MAISRNKIYYLGPKGSYTEQAAKLFFGKNRRLTEISSIYQILNRVVQEKSVYGAVPVENSTEGSLNIVLDTVIENNLKIIGESYLSISHCLLSKEKKLKSIKTIYAHPQALAQSNDWLRNNLLQVKTVETQSSSAAAVIVAGQKGSAAIASDYCAKIYKLNILASQLEENPNNYTRFWVLTRKIVSRKTNDKISVFIILNDRVGALRDLLNIFTKYNINLSKIESRALKGQVWRYGFFIDFLGNLQNSRIKKALREIEHDVAWLQILGNYQNQQHPEKTTDYLINYLQDLFKNNKRWLGAKLPFESLRAGSIGSLAPSDNLLTKLLQTRLLLTPSVALYKYSNKIPLNKIYQPKREQEIIKKRLIQIKKKNISASKLLIQLAKQNLANSRKLQKEIYQGLLSKKIKTNQIKSIELNKLRQFIDQIDENFDEVLAGLSRKEQEKALEDLLKLWKI